MFEMFVARRYISSDPKMVLFAILSVALAIGVIVVLTGINEGYKSQLVTSLVENSPHLTISPKENEDYITLYRTLSGIASSYPGVEAVSPRLLGRAGAKHKDEVQVVSFIGADPLKEGPLLKVQKEMVMGDYSDLIFKRHAAVLGIKLAEDLELKMGDRFSLIRQNRSLRLTVVGLIKTGTGSDQTLVYLPLQTAQSILGERDVVSEVGVRLSDIYAAPSIASDLNTRTNYKAESWQEQNKDSLQVLETQNIILYLFIGLILVIAGFGVANTMIMNVMGRTKEIGILMAMGATRWSIIKIYLAQSLILGPPAALLGSILAYLVARVINDYPIHMPGSDFNTAFRMTVLITSQTYIFAVIFSLFINFLAGIYPAYKASELDPVEAIGS